MDIALKYFLLLLFSMSMITCQNDSPSTQTTTTAIPSIKHPTTPEAVVRLYQSFLDANKFDEAKRLGTTAEQERLEMLKGIITGELLDSTVVQTNFIALNCNKEGDKALCLGRYIAEENEEYEDTFRLTKINEKWLIDITSEDGAPALIFEEEKTIEQ